jgi:hypothetical protein
METEKAEFQRTLYPCDVKIAGKVYPVYVFVSYEDKDSHLSLAGSIGSLDPLYTQGWGQINSLFRSRQPEMDDPRFVRYELEDLFFSPGWTARAWLDLLDTWRAFHLRRVSQIPTYVRDWLWRLPD